jgi:competence protein ComFC
MLCEEIMLFNKSVFFKILNFIYPQSCYLCEKTLENSGLCSSCFIKLQQSHRYSCDMCGVELKIEGRCLPCLSNPKAFDSVSYVYVYNAEVFKLINGFKNHDRLYLLKFLSNLLAKKFLEKDITNKVDIIIPVPIHYSKLIKRKYNHSALLGNRLGKKIKKICKTQILQKSKKTKDQMTLNGKKRIDNVKNSFNINKKHLNYLSGKNILLLDDVLTTGSTINECVKTLKGAGVGSIHVLCLARVDGYLKI